MTTEIQQKRSIKDVMQSDLVKSKFAEILGRNPAPFIQAVTTIALSPALEGCDVNSIVGCGIAAATLGLSVSPQLGQAAIVPYTTGGKKIAQFQIMSRGYLALAMRSGEVKKFNVGSLYEGQLTGYDVITGDITVDGLAKKSDTVIGYFSYIELTNGFSKTFYMSKEEVLAHAKKYSKTFNSQYGAWKTNEDAMCKKTVAKLLLSRYAPLSFDQRAIEYDQAKLSTSETLDIDVTYCDSNETQGEVNNDLKPTV